MNATAITQAAPLETLDSIGTPALVLDLTRVGRNVARLTRHLGSLGVDFRPHVKTSKSVDVVKRMFPLGRGPITVSTIGEAEYFADAGFYRDSKANAAGLVGGGGFWHATDHLRLGAALVLLKSDTYNHNKAFVAPLPVAAYEGRRVTFNMVYMPKWQDINKTNQVGFWLTFWLP